MKAITYTLLLTLFSLNSFGSSALFIKKDLFYFGKNFDWTSGSGVVMKNNRNIRKTAYGIDQSNVASWTSKFGSLTFNQFGKEFPYGGMNEKGLVVEMLQFPDAQYENSNQPTLSELEWIQYQLDNFKTVPEVELHLDSLSINPFGNHLHYMVADAQGRSVVIEFINGKVQTYKNNENFQALTNNSYLSSEKYYADNKNTVNYQSKSSFDRYSQLNEKGGMPRHLSDMFDIMGKSAVQENGYKTQWTIIYDLRTLRVHFQSAQNTSIKTIEMKAFDFSSNAPILFMDIHSSVIEFKFLSQKNNPTFLQDFFVGEKIKLNEIQVKEHMLTPSKKIIDEQYSKNFRDLTVTFNIRRKEGLLYYTLIKEKENFKSLNGYKSGNVSAETGMVTVQFYSIPNGEYVVAAFHDLDNNGKLSKGLFKVPSEPYALSNNAKGIFGLPKYERASFNLADKNKLTIKIK